MAEAEEKRTRHTKKELRELASSVRDGTFHYEGKPKRSLDWSSYEEAQAREVSDMLLSIKRFVEIAAGRIPPEEYERRRRRGRPITYPPSDVAKALLLQSYFGVSNRVASGLVDLFKEKLGISKAFSYKTIERGYDPSLVTRIVQEVFRLTNELGNEKETTFSFDGTGDITSSKTNYESVRSEQRKTEEKKDPSTRSWPSSSPAHSFQFAELSVGVHTQMIAGFTSSADYSMGELLMFPSVLSQTRINCPGMDTILGDALYSTRNACSMVTRYGARPYFFPKVNSIFMSHGVPSWKTMMYEFVEDPQRWLSIYHMRSISETVNSVDKRRFPWKLKKRLAWRKATESFLRREVYNIRRYSYLGYLHPDLVTKIPR